MPKRQIHQMLPTLTYGDAIGNYTLALRSLFREWGFESEIFAERWHPRLAKECHPYEAYGKRSHADNLVLLHYSIGGEINTYACNLPDKVILYYHNITPPHYFYQVNGELARQLYEARQTLETLAEKFPVIAASPYNAQELEGMGFDVLGVAIPCIGTVERLTHQTDSADAVAVRNRFAKKDTFDWLYLGRLSPNKCVHDVIKAFYYYHTWIRSSSQLLIVGTGEGLEPYVDSLYRLISQLQLDGAIVFAGHCTDEALPAFYEIADVYISMSEHEGFGIPMVEAMVHGRPIVAYASTGVPFTLGNAGVLIKRKEPAIIAEVVHEIELNPDLRQRLIEGQRAQAATFTSEAAKRQIEACLHPFVDRLR